MNETRTSLVDGRIHSVMMTSIVLSTMIGTAFVGLSGQTYGNILSG